MLSRDLTEGVQRFRQDWESGNVPRIEDFVTDIEVLGVSTSDHRRVLLELIKADMYYRWRRGTPKAAQDRPAELDAMSPNEAGDRLPPQPKLEDYVATFVDVAPVESIPCEIIAEEYRIRQQFGDRPGRDEYFGRFAQRRDEIDLVLRRVDTELQNLLPLVHLKVFRDRKLVFKTRLCEEIEIGRQQEGEPGPYCRSPIAEGERIIVASLPENTISRRHVQIKRNLDGTIFLTNRSANCPVMIADACHLDPGATSEIELPALLEIGDRVIRLELDESESVVLKGLPQATQIPGQMVSPPTQLGGLAGNRPDIVDVDIVIPWLNAMMGVFQSSASSEEFLSQATMVATEMVGLDTVAILSHENGEWKMRASSVPSGRVMSPNWEPSRTILDRVYRAKRTFRNVPSGHDAQSLAGVKGLVASPILDLNGTVIGVLYGDRRPSTGSDKAITEIEATLVELLACGVASGLARLEQEQAAIAARIQFEQFFTPELARHLELEPDLLNGRDSEVTLLFADIRGFSRISERMGPQKTVEWTRDVLQELSDCVIAHQGVLVDYIGDELIAMWGAPVEQPNHATLACLAAQQMIARLPVLNDRWVETIGASTEFGIGINTGIARVGNTGTRHKFKYGPLGNTVNLASRVQGATKHARSNLLVTGSTVEQLEPGFFIRRLCRVRVVNINEPVDLYELTVNASEPWQNMTQEYESALSAFEQQDFSTATQLLGNLLAKDPNDGPSVLLLSRAAQAMAEPPAEFDSVWDFESK